MQPDVRSERRPGVGAKPGGIQAVLAIMNSAIASCESALLSFDVSIAEASISKAKKAYLDAFKRAGRISFDSQDVIAFEWNSILLETVIARLQRQCDSWKNHNV